MHPLSRLCHGRPRRPAEPHGVAAPLVRAVGSALVSLGAVVFAVATVTGRDALTVTGKVALWVMTAGVLVRSFAHTVRPDEVILTSVEP
jgi:hypothetical protein